MRFLKLYLILFFFLVFVLVHCAKEKETNSGSRDPQYRFTLPSEGSWVIYRTTQYSGGFVSAWRSIFILQGAHWRLELEKHRGPVTVAIYDGQKLYLSRKANLKPEDLNRLIFYGQAYQALQQQFVFDANEEVNGYACQRFIGSGTQGTHAMLWVETQGHMIRKAFSRLESGEALTEEFLNLPAGIQMPDNLFDPENLNPVLLTQLKSWKIK
ncbi:MAG: hypothetical protein EHM45_10970 [Desulfobacteraceae bacterium]|nr:MAG: hypothetical protein EHM45_10970 [Desulfobacteraceae bacterium]